jgi:hypothetical protein
MAKASHRYNDYIFSNTGRPQFGESVKVERTTSGRPRRRIIRYAISHWFLEQSFADNAKRYMALRKALETPEGMLVIVDEAGKTLVEKRVTVEANELPPQWGQHLMEVTVAFIAVEEMTGLSEFDAEFTPAGGSAIVLPKISAWKEGVNASRYSIDVPNRRESVMTVSARGSVRANPEHSPAARLAFLHAQKEILMGADAKDGVLAYAGAGFSETVRIDFIECDPIDGHDEMTWTLTATRRMFPSGMYAEASFEVSQSDALEANERRTVVAGTIRANDEAAAEIKREAIRVAYATSGRMLMDRRFQKTRAEGADGNTDIPQWGFSFTFREILPGAVESWTLAISDKEDSQSGNIVTTYSGKVTAASSAAAIAYAAVLGANKYPMLISNDTNTVQLSAGGASAQFIETTFSYTYQRKGTVQFAEVKAATQIDPFGASAIVVSGTAAAATEAAALALARTFKPSSALMALGSQEITEKTVRGAGTLFQRVTFSYSAHLDPSSSTLDYKVSTSEDPATRKKTTTYSGRAIAPTEVAANGLIDAVVVAPSEGVRIRNERVPAFRKGSDGAAHFTGMDFSVSFVSKMADDGSDIIEAQSSLEIQPARQNNVIIRIPFGDPYVQTNTGIVPGSAVASGYCIALNQSTAEAWAAGVSAPSGYAAGSKTKLTKNFMSFSGSVVLTYRVDFSYSTDTVA